MYILAKGKLFGRKLQVEYLDKKFYFDDKENSHEMRILDVYLQKKPVIAGTYISEDAYEDINIYNVLEKYFFDAPPTIQAEDVPTMPSEKGVIY